MHLWKFNSITQLIVSFLVLYMLEVHHWLLFPHKEALAAFYAEWQQGGRREGSELLCQLVIT